MDTSGHRPNDDVSGNQIRRMRGMAVQRGLRQMSHYFDYDAYVQQVNEERVSDTIRRFRPTRREIETLKERKRQMKRKKMLDWLRKD